jgi:DNA polymerase-3 subunit delta
MDNMGEAKAINGDLVQKFIGISKDYNTFELNNALLQRDRVKAFRVINYYAANPKAGPTVVVIGGLYSLFSKLYLLHAMKAASSGEVAGALGVNPYFVKDYKSALRWYDVPKIRNVIGLLHRYDSRSKGIDDVGTDDGELLRELVWQILN